MIFSNKAKFKYDGYNKLYTYKYDNSFMDNFRNAI